MMTNASSTKFGQTLPTCPLSGQLRRLSFQSVVGEDRPRTPGVKSRVVV